MRTKFILLFLGPITVIGFAALPMVHADDEEDEYLRIHGKAIFTARDNVNRAAGLIQTEDPTKQQLRGQQAKEISKNHKLEYAMRGAFGPKARGGIGIGKLVTSGHKDGIEMLIQNYARKPPTATEVARHYTEIVRIAHITKVMSEILSQYPPPRSPRGAEDWREKVKYMNERSIDFFEAVRSEDHRKIAASAFRLNSACFRCHIDYRS